MGQTSVVLVVVLAWLISIKQQQKYLAERLYRLKKGLTIKQIMMEQKHKLWT